MARIPFPKVGDVEVWSATNNVSSETMNKLERTLNVEERNQRDKFKFETHRRAYIFSQGLLRTILGQYLSLQPSEIEFRMNGYGKPFLSNATSATNLMFNMSHSGNLVLVAVTQHRLVGVDVESIRAIADLESIASQYFTAAEQALLNGTRGRDYGFYTCWTRKEAFIKAVGKGLSIPLTSFDTSMPFGASGRQLPSTADAPEVSHWWLSDLQVLEGYAGAVVTEGETHRVIHRMWTDAGAIPPVR